MVTIRYLKSCAVLALLLVGVAYAEVSAPDERYKADILLVVAHPDDDTVISGYLTRAINDQHKRVAVVFCTRGDSGGNMESRERARALGLVREIEGRRAMAALGITNVWFLDGRDTPSQNVLFSLGIWPSAAVREQMVRIFRLTRPEVVLTWLPSSVAGENHGDHQAAGVIATEAFDLAGDPSVFASQLGPGSRIYENALEGLTPWQAKKIYYFTDAFDVGFMKGHGPEYSSKDVSPSRGVSYLELAAKSAAVYYTQSPDPQVNRRIERGGSEAAAAIAKLQEIGYLPEPNRLWLGKSLVKCDFTGDVFEGVTPNPMRFHPVRRPDEPDSLDVEYQIGGAWGFYRQFWRAHELDSLRFMRPEIAVQPNDILTVPILIKNPSDQPLKVTVGSQLPAGWKQKGENIPFTIPAMGQSTAFVRVVAPGEQSNDFADVKAKVMSGASVLNTTDVYVKVSGAVFVKVDADIGE
jgi:LmbE family N-acetylglucosaminyl deacetylase